jgi:UDP-glucuronate decarboxylase
MKSSKNNLKKVLVTGGSGFIGSHICLNLVKKGYDVLCVDNLFSSSKQNINHLLKFNNFEFQRHDVTFPLFLETDQIYNLACPASPVHYQRDPVQTMKTNIHGTINMLGLAKRTKSRIFQASTSEVYGDPEISPQKEDYLGKVNPLGPRACYDEGKRAAETLFFDYHRQHKVDIRVARIFNTYGPRMHPNDGRVVSNFICQALKNKNITIYGNGTQTRSFCYIDDLVRGILKFMESQKIIGPINFGNPNEISILELAELVIQQINSKSKITFNSLPVDDPKMRCPDITLAKNNINWEPKVSLKDGLKKTVDYFDKLLSGGHY